MPFVEGKSLRILLVNAINPYVEVERRYPNLGLGYLIASARKSIPRMDIDFRIVDRHVDRAIEGFQPHLAGVTSVSQNFTIARDYARLLSRHGVPVIMGGVHITSLPHLLPEGAAAACLGEGENTFVDIIRARMNGTLDADTLSRIPGLAYRRDGEIVHSPDRNPVENLDDLPMPAREYLEVRPHTYMFTSRGCPYRCSFCSSSRFWSNLRFFSADYVTEEIDLLNKRHNVRMISFFDDLFAANRKRLVEIVARLEKKNLLGKLKFTCSLRANIIDRELAQILARMGVVSVGIGFESGDEATLAYLKAGSVKVAHNFRAVDILKKEGIRVNGSFVIGAPLEGHDQIQRTYDFVRHSGLDLFDVYVLTPYPGTPVWDYAKGRGLVDESAMDWSRLDVNFYKSADKAVILSEKLSRDEIVAWYRKFRRLRLAHNMMNVVNHPLRRDLPRMALGHAAESLARISKRFCAGRARSQGKG